MNPLEKAIHGLKNYTIPFLQNEGAKEGIANLETVLQALEFAKRENMRLRRFVGKVHNKPCAPCYWYEESGNILKETP